MQTNLMQDDHGNEKILKIQNFDKLGEDRAAWHIGLYC